ncbi:testis-expressed protein 22 [Camelus ferus]|uniref:Testis-expressed protein 22 n=2 Tax=Camelus TaxID=9836 RepID=A0A8B8T927_CAMFR|nr:testis-expressed protein 22 [Camelus ferus]
MDSGKHLFKALLGKKPESQLSQEDGQPSATPSPAVAWGQPSAQSSSQQVLQTQDWVCEPPESRRPSRRWSVSISERRRLAALGGCERPEHADAKPTPTPSGRDLPRIVAELVSQGVDKDVLLPCPPRSTESTNAFHAFLVRSAPFWRNMTLEAQASRSPPS